MCILGLSQLVVLAAARRPPRPTQFGNFPRKDALDAWLPPPASRHVHSGIRSHDLSVVRSTLSPLELAWDPWVPFANCPALGVIQSMLCSCLGQFSEVLSTSLCVCVCVCVCPRAPQATRAYGSGRRLSQGPARGGPPHLTALHARPVCFIRCFDVQLDPLYPHLMVSLHPPRERAHQP